MITVLKGEPNITAEEAIKKYPNSYIAFKIFEDNLDVMKIKGEALALSDSSDEIVDWEVENGLFFGATELIGTNILSGRMNMLC